LIRLTVVVEGQTEEAFVKHILGPHLDALEVFTTAIVVTTRRDRATGKKLGRGGGDWSKWRKELRQVMRDGRADARFTTLFDLYGLPGNFPRLAEHAACADTVERVARLEQAMADDMNDARFIPYLQRHEFEALVLAGLEQLELVLDAREDLSGCRSLREVIAILPPEDVNDGPTTAPSKRLHQAIPSYQKTVHGPLVLDALGLVRLRGACPRLDTWIAKLESLATEGRA